MTGRIMLVLFLVVYLPLTVRGSEKEDAYKATWMGKFAVFVTWPNETNMKNKSKPFIIGVIGQTPFIWALGKVYNNQKIMNKRVVLKYFETSNDIEEIETCHILYLSPSVKDYLSKIISDVKNKPILIVADSKRFAQKGVHINFYRKGPKLHFEINGKAAEDAKLLLSAQLLRIGKRVTIPGNTR